MELSFDPKTEWLFLSDDKIFYTLEGEGRYIGHPSVFLRTSLCNLTCKGFASKDSPHGCDSYVSWSVKNRMTFEEIAIFMEEQKIHEKLLSGAILKLTGGEPLIWQDKLLKLCQYFQLRWGFTDPIYSIRGSKFLKPILKIDFETNGTIAPRPEWITQFGATFTTSPKLSSNGDPEDKRFKPEVLKWLVDTDACFKFVVKSEQDIEEIVSKYINNPDICLRYEQIWFMPCCGSQEELIANGPMVAELAKKYGVKFSNRMHLQIWNKALKV